MLRTFCSNPALGGFGGGETTAATAPTPDAFCQIIKELVDNAVDACTVESLSTATTAKRVRVVIERFQEGDDDDNTSSDSSSNEILRVTVSDNGCGMSDIAKCVGAFHTSKAHNTTAAVPVDTRKTKKRKACSNNNSTVSSSSRELDIATTEAQTAGRYGIGLTLCLLHAQRLVPNSCASIQSAVASDKEWTVVAAVVDAASDAVRCLPRDSLKKRVASESGTAISILVPGGQTATLAWPRLAEYFARFKLSLGITCSLEVLAPTLSRVPLWVSPTAISNDSSLITKQSKQMKAAKKTSPTSAANDIFEEEDERWYKRLDSDTEESDDSEDDAGCKGKGPSVSSTNTADQDRITICKATQLFLGRPVDLENVAHAIVPIRARKTGRKSKTKNQASTGPKIEIDIIVYGPDEDDPGENEADEEFDNARTRSDDDESIDTLDDIVKKFDDASNSSSASMVLVRMVNKIPLLDSTEAVACGLVQGLASKKRMWNSFGLDVGLKHDPSNVGSLPTFEVRDSEQVAPFFKKGAHNLLEKEDEDERFTEQEESDEESDGDNGIRAIKTKRQSKRRNLLPASVRLGKVLVIAQIHAEPTSLPLPTLSKGRLPIDNSAIDDALEACLTKCLQQLQKTNPNLLLTASELRKAERDCRYVPAVSLALASILTKSVTNQDPSIIERIQRWGNDHAIPANIVTMSDDSSAQVADTQEVARPSTSFETEDVERVGKLIEGRLRLVISQPQKSNQKTTQQKKEEEVEEEEAEKESEKSETSSLDLDLPSVDIPWHLLDQDNDATEKQTKNRGSDIRGDKLKIPDGAKDAYSANSGEDYDDWL